MAKLEATVSPSEGSGQRIPGQLCWEHCGFEDQDRTGEPHVESEYIHVCREGSGRACFQPVATSIKCSLQTEGPVFCSADPSVVCVPVHSQRN